MKRHFSPPNSAARHPRDNSVSQLAVAMLATTFSLVAPGWALAQNRTNAVLPPGVNAVWDQAKAYRETTPTRERLCINGLWRWQPATENTREVPTAAWGYYKVPACWPGIQDYMQSDYQTLYPDPSWKDAKLGDVQRAWYERTITIPQDWAGRRISLEVEYLNSYAIVYVDGHQAGQIRFPTGQVDLSGAVLFPGSEDRRYGLVKRALASGEIIRIRRGLYCLAPKYQKKSVNLYAMAQRVHGPSSEPMSVKLIQDRRDSHKCKSNIEEEHTIRQITQDVVLAALGRTEFFRHALFQG